MLGGSAPPDFGAESAAPSESNIRRGGATTPQLLRAAAVRVGIGARQRESARQQKDDRDTKRKDALGATPLWKLGVGKNHWQEISHPLTTSWSLIVSPTRYNSYKCT